MCNEKSELVKQLTVSYSTSEVIFPNPVLTTKGSSNLVVDTHVISSESLSSIFVPVHNDSGLSDLSGQVICSTTESVFTTNSMVSQVNSNEIVDTSSNSIVQPVFLNHDGSSVNTEDIQYNSSITLTMASNGSGLNDDQQVESNIFREPAIITNQTCTSKNVPCDATSSVFATQMLTDNAQGPITNTYIENVYANHKVALQNTFQADCSESSPVLVNQPLPNTGTEVAVDVSGSSENYQQDTYVNQDTVIPNKNELQLENSLQNVPNPEYTVLNTEPQSSSQIENLNVVVYSGIFHSPQDSALKSSQFKGNSKERSSNKNRIRTEASYTCDSCGSCFEYKSRLISHMESKHSSVILRCSKCSYSTKSRQLLAYHQSIHNGSFRCKVCGKLFTRRIYLEYHFSHKHRGSVLYHACTLCGAKFQSKGGLNRHTQTKHEPSKNYACSLCTYVGTCANGLANHVLRLHNKQYQCKICDYSSTSEGGLNRHMMIVHNEEERQFPCQYCSYRGAKRRQLLEHEKNMHNPDSTRHQCPICKKLFKTNVMMKHHLLCHTDHHFYRCKGCNYTTRHRQTLHYHIKRTHPGQDVKELSIGPSEADFQAIISAATQELLPVDQQVEVFTSENYTVVPEVIQSAEMILSHDYLQPSYDLQQHTGTVICDLSSKDPVTESHEQVTLGSNLPTDLETEQSVAIIDSSGLINEEVHEIVTFADDLNIGKHEIDQFVNISEKEPLQTLTPLNNVNFSGNETQQVVTYIESLESLKSSSHEHIATLLNSQDLQPDKEKVVQSSVTHINLVDSGNTSEENVIILPLAETDVTVFHQDLPGNQEQPVGDELGLVQHNSLLTIQPETQLEIHPQYEEEVSSWNHVTVYHLDT